MNNNPNNKVDPSFVVIAGMSYIANKLESIDKKLEKKVAYMLSEDAVKAFRAYIEENHSNPRNFKYLLEQFDGRFQGKNVCEITADEVHDFMAARWGAGAASTFNKQKDRLGNFFDFAIKKVKRKGSPSFHNPIELIDKSRKVSDGKQFEYIDVETMKSFLDTFTNLSHWLWATIMMTAGLRVGEVLKLRKMDINGRILTLVRPKSGRSVEVAVVPQLVADVLSEYIEKNCTDERLPLWEGRLRREAKNYLNEMGVDDFHAMKDDPFWKKELNSAMDGMTKKCGRAITSHGKQVGLKLSNHSLRKWTATFYSRHGNTEMQRFVLRHSSVAGEITALEARYIAPLSVVEASAAQSKLLTPALFGGDNE